jgi:hypothetical protein
VGGVSSIWKKQGKNTKLKKEMKGKWKEKEKKTGKGKRFGSMPE